jgi:ankyrin repeat protein
MTFEGVVKHFSKRGLAVKDVRAYLDAGGDVNCLSPKNCWTLLHFAVEDRNLEVIKLLASRGADLNVPDVNGWTPLHLAVDSDMDTSGRDGRRATELPTAKLLVELGASATTKAADGKTARGIALDYGLENLFDSVAGTAAREE